MKYVHTFSEFIKEQHVNDASAGYGTEGRRMSGGTNGSRTYKIYVPLLEDFINQDPATIKFNR